MKRIMVTQIGEPRESLTVHEVPELTPKKGEVLVEMMAIPIHPADLLVMRGRHKCARQNTPLALELKGPVG